jgi:RNA polymerase sigma-70 factor, ECF subfamily
MDGSTETANHIAEFGHELLSAHGDALYRYAMLRLRSTHAAEDAVQETLLAALSQLSGRLPGFEGRSRQRTWLIGILRNKIVDHFRRLVKELPSLTQTIEAPPREFFDRGKWREKPRKWHTLCAEDPQILLEHAELQTILLNCLSALPSRLARVFMLREAEGLGSAEICQLFNLSAANFWAILHRARLHLRRCLESRGISNSLRKSKARTEE